MYLYIYIDNLSTKLEKRHGNINNGINEKNYFWNSEPVRNI